MSTIKLSLVIPIEKADPIIQLCLCQILENYKKVQFSAEIIIATNIDLEELNKFEKENNVRVVRSNKKNVDIYNQALESCNGEYICFYSIGDVIDFKAIGKAISIASTSNADLLVAKQFAIMPDDTVRNYGDDFDAINLTYFQASEELINDCNLYSKLYKTEFLKKENMRFVADDGIFEKVFVWKSYLLAEKICKLPTVIYGNRIRSTVCDLDRSINKVLSIIAIDALMRGGFQQKDMFRCYLQRILNHEIQEVLSDWASGSYQNNDDLEKNLLRDFVGLIIDQSIVDIRSAISEQSRRLLVGQFPEFKSYFPGDVEEQYEFTNQWFLTAKGIWEAVFPTIKPVRILEIGSYEGAAACFLIEYLEKNDGGEVHCIDTWEGGLEHQKGGDAFTNMSLVEQRYIKNVSLALSKTKHVMLHKHKGLSDHMLVKLLSEGKSGYFDFIYIDGSHQAPDVLTDAILSFKLLRVGGVIAFDDYLWSEPLPNGVDPIRCPKIAIDAFTNIFCRKVNVLSTPLYQLYVQKHSN